MFQYSNCIKLLRLTKRRTVSGPPSKLSLGTMWGSDDSLSSHYTTMLQANPHRLRESSGFVVAGTEPSLESQYIYKHLGKILPKCLAEVIEKRPKDPIEYMAHWIYKWRENEIRAKQVTKYKS